jgi:phosphodiesterase/alkaline phosphatase D-like protein
VTEVGSRIELTVTNLRPNTTYFYAIAARDNVSRRLGPRSPAVKVRTR